MTTAERKARRAAFDALPADRQQAIRDRIQQLLERQHWTFAKTMPENPHWWSARKAWRDDADFCFVVEHIRVLGYKAKFGRAIYTQYDCGEFFYWTMWRPLNWPDGTQATTVINRKPLTQKSTSALPLFG
jgi:hypothetical protein